MTEPFQELWTNTLGKQEGDDLAHILLSDEIGDWAEFYTAHRRKIAFLEFAGLDTLIRLRKAEGKRLDNDIIDALEDGLKFWSERIFKDSFTDEKEEKKPEDLL